LGIQKINIDRSPWGKESDRRAKEETKRRTWGQNILEKKKSSKGRQGNWWPPLGGKEKEKIAIELGGRRQGVGNNEKKKQS